MTTETQTQTDEKELVPGSPEYDAAMAARFREAKNDAGTPYPDLDTGEDTPQDQDEDTNTAPTIPDSIPAKFVRKDGTVDVEALAKSYSDLEKMLGSKKPEDSQSSQEEGETTKDDEVASNAASAAGLEYDALVAKIQEQGDLDASDYEAFAKAGIPEEVVQEYIALRQDAADRGRQEALEYIGGEQEANDLLTWAATNLTPAEIDGYNAMLAGPQWKAAVDTLRTLRGGAKPTAGEPKLRTAAGSAGGSSTGYASRDEMRADMANPLYHDNGPKGEQFRAEVQRKMAFAAWRRS